MIAQPDFLETLRAEHLAMYGQEWSDGLRQLPDYMQGEMLLYLVHRIRPENFLSALLSNDFMGALDCADSYNCHHLWTYGNFLRNHAPDESYGSVENFNAWIKK